MGYIIILTAELIVLMTIHIDIVEQTQTTMFVLEVMPQHVQVSIYIE